MRFSGITNNTVYILNSMYNRDRPLIDDMGFSYDYKALPLRKIKCRVIAE